MVRAVQPIMPPAEGHDKARRVVRSSKQSQRALARYRALDCGGERAQFCVNMAIRPAGYRHVGSLLRLVWRSEWSMDP